MPPHERRKLDPTQGGSSSGTEGFPAGHPLVPRPYPCPRSVGGYQLPPGSPPKGHRPTNCSSGKLAVDVANHRAASSSQEFRVQNSLGNGHHYDVAGERHINFVASAIAWGIATHSAERTLWQLVIQASRLKSVGALIVIRASLHMLAILVPSASPSKTSARPNRPLPSAIFPSAMWTT
jgi:hypothetical protein